MHNDKKTPPRESPPNKHTKTANQKPNKRSEKSSLETPKKLAHPGPTGGAGSFAWLKPHALRAVTSFHLIGRRGLAHLKDPKSEAAIVKWLYMQSCYCSLKRTRWKGTEGEYVSVIVYAILMINIHYMPTWGRGGEGQTVRGWARDKG